MFVLALSIPESFDDLPGGLHGPVVLAVCYFLFRLMHLVMFWVIASVRNGASSVSLPDELDGTARSYSS